MANTEHKHVGPEYVNICQLCHAITSVWTDTLKSAILTIGPRCGNAILTIGPRCGNVILSLVYTHGS